MYTVVSTFIESCPPVEMTCSPHFDQRGVGIVSDKRPLELLQDVYTDATYSACLVCESTDVKSAFRRPMLVSRCRQCGVVWEVHVKPE